MTKCSTAPTPITSTRTEEDGEDLSKEQHSQYRRAVGIARYLRILRPDIGYTVKELSHRLAAPKDQDAQRLRRLTRYLSGTKGLGVFFPRAGKHVVPEDMALVGFSDSDWAGDRLSRKSTSSGIIYWGPFLVADLCKGQSVIATSSAEAELYSAVSVLKDMILIKRVLEFFELSPKLMLKLDSSSARSILSRQGVGRIRHVEVACLWAQQWVKEKEVQLLTEPTASNQADLNTKVHSIGRFRALMDLIGMKDVNELKEDTKEALTVAAVAPAVHGPLASLVAFLSQLMLTEAAECAADSVSEDTGDAVHLFVLGGLLIVVAIAGVVIGWIARGWRMTVDVPTVVQNSEAETQTVVIPTESKATMSQVTYKRDRATPRFHPLPEFTHGAWRA